MTAAWLLAAFVAAQGEPVEQPERPPDDFMDTVDEYFDMNGASSRPLFMIARPLSMNIGALFSSNGTEPLAQASLPILRIASQWGEARVLTLDGASTPNSSWAGGTLLSIDEYLCREPGEGYQLMVPLASELPGVLGIMRCDPHEHWGYFLDLVQLYVRPRIDQTALRIAEGGMFFDVLGNGRTEQVRANRLQIMLGGASDAIWYDTNSALTARAVLKVRGTVTSDGRRLRAMAELAWLPSVIAPLTDNLFEGTLVAGVFFVPERKNAIFLRARGRISYAQRPGMTVSSWADPTVPVSGSFDLGVDVTFGE